MYRDGGLTEVTVYRDGGVTEVTVYRDGGLTEVSRPLLRLLLGDIGFVYPVMSMVVIGPSSWGRRYNRVRFPAIQEVTV